VKILGGVAQFKGAASLAVIHNIKSRFASPELVAVMGIGWLAATVGVPERTRLPCQETNPSGKVGENTVRNNYSGDCWG
jgi:hypothetical protein